MATTGSTPQSADISFPQDTVSQFSPVEQVVRLSYERSAINADKYARQVIQVADSAAERSRRMLAARRLAILADAHGPLIRSALDNWLTPAVFKAVTGEAGDHLDISRNPAKRIWEEMATLYSRPPMRTAKRKSDIKAYQALLKGTHFDLFWRAVELRLQACNEILLYPEAVTLPGGDKVVKHRYATPDRFTLIASEDDPTVMEALVLIDCYKDLSGVRHTTYTIWTPHWHVQYAKDGGTVERVGRIPPVPPEDEDRVNPDANPYGCIPHVLIHRDYPMDGLLDQTSGEDLVNLTVGNGERRCILRYNEKMSGFKGLAVTGGAVHQAPQALLDPGSVVKVEGSDINLQVIDWQIDIEKQQKVLDRDEERAAASRGINAQRYKSTGDYQGAAAARGADQGLTERRVGEMPIYAAAEAEYATSLAMVAKHAGMDGPPLDIALEVKHAPIEYPADPKEQLALDTGRIALGLESAVTIKQREHPTWTREECWAEIQRNIEDTAKVNDMKVRHNVPADPQKESMSAEDNGAMGGRPPLDQTTTDSPGRAAPAIPTTPEE